MRKAGIFICTALAVVVFFQSCKPKEPVSFLQPVQPPYAIQIVANHGLTSIAPQNTIPAIQAAIDVGIPWVKLDIRATKDGHLVAVNDVELQNAGASANKPGMLTFSEMENLDVGSWFSSRYRGTRIPELKDVLALCRNKVNIIVDGSGTDPEMLAHEIKAADMENQVMVTGEEAIIRTVHEISLGHIATMAGFQTSTSTGSASPQVYTIMAYQGKIDGSVVSELHRQHLSVLADLTGVDDTPDVWRQGIADGMDFILTDNAEGAMAVYQRSLVPSSVKNMVSAHRGANQFAPENTLAAYEQAIEMEADFIEIDVRQTKDDHLVILHDGSLDRTTAAQGSVKEALFDSVRNLSAGAWFGSPYKNEKVPTLEEVCQLLSRLNAHNTHKTNLYMDCKDPDVPMMVKTLEKYQLLDGAVFYGSEETLRKIRDADPRAKLMPPLEDPDKIVEQIDRIHPYAFDTRWPDLSEDLIKKAHDHGVKIFSDAMDDNESMDKYQKAIQDGIDLIQTDHLLGVYRAMDLMGNKAK